VDRGPQIWTTQKFQRGAPYAIWQIIFRQILLHKALTPLSD